MSNVLGAGLNDGWTVGAASRIAVVALVEVFIRASEAGPATFTRLSVSHTVVSTWNKCADPVEKAAPGTIRGDFGLETQFNLVHGSDSTESAEREIALWFAQT